MKIIRAEKMGFCAGVRHAVKTADNALEENKNGQVYSFGPLIHNPLALKTFENRGLKILDEEKNFLCKKRRYGCNSGAWSSSGNKRRTRKNRC